MIKYILLSIFYFSANSYAEYQYHFDENDYQFLKSHINVNKNSFTREQLNDSLKALIANKNITSAQFVLKNNKVKIQMKETVEEQAFEVRGNQALTSPEIMTVLNVNNNKKIDRFEMEKNIPLLKEKYDSIGIKKVSIDLKEKIEEKKITYILDVNEGSSALLQEISVISANKFLNNHIKFKLNEFKGKKIDKELLKSIENITEEVLIANRFLDAKIAKISPVYSQDRKIARIIISLETTLSYDFLFYGNHYFSTGNILSHLDIDKNFLNYIKNQKLLQKNIENYYKKSGFAKVEVASKVHFFSDLNKYVIVFEINEGPQIRIQSVDVSGKISRNPQYYEDLFFQSLGEVKNSNLFIEGNIEQAADQMILHLKDEGYLRAEMINLDYKFTTPTSIHVQIQINENILTQIRNITFIGLKTFTSSQLYDVIELRPNSPLNLVKLKNSYAQLKTFYQKNGYLEFEILTLPENLIKYVDNYEFADITFEIKEGPQIRIKDVKVRGNTFTKDKVVIREIDLREGDVLTSDKINDSIIFLERTQLFSRAQINTSDPNTMISDRSIFVDVQEKNPGLLSSGLGLSNERNVTLRSYLGISYQNLGGTGRGISARADVRYSVDPDIQYPENRIVIGYYEPYLFFNRLRARISLQRDQQVFDTQDNVVTIQENNQINFLIEKQINRKLKLIWHLWDLSVLRNFDRETGNDKSKIKIANIGPAIEWDRRDDIFVPTSGSFTVAQVEYSNPFLGSTNNTTDYVDFVKATAGHIVYTPLTANRRWVLVNEVRGGFVDNLSDRPNSGVPGARVFFLGGRSTLRGYDLRDNERVPSLKEVCGANCQSITDFKVSTASHFYLTKNEIRFPLSGDNIGGLIFYDGAAVFINGVSILDHYRDTAGFGFRYITPIGAFTGEIGFKLDRKKESPVYNNENAFTLHFSMGTF